MSAGPWAVVLGASTGVGAAIARALARDPGLHVFGVHRGHHPEDAQRLEDDVRATGRRIVLHVGDAGTPEGVRTCGDALAAVVGTGGAAFVVHSISGASLGRFLDTRGDAFTVRQVEKTFSYLAHSFVYWAQRLHADGLLAPSARLLGLTNVLHDSLLNNTGLVAAAKAALEMYVKHLAIEFGPSGHRVNLLKFGTVLTPAVRSVMGPEAAARLEAIHADLIPAGRMSTAEDVAAFVSILAREETGWLNGATIDFTGGMTLRLLDVVLQPDSSHLKRRTSAGGT
jgi:NAD(P)-dependent dehydrogenase (short-subunit alcohol dehydrogenase family)